MAKRKKGKKRKKTLNPVAVSYKWLEVFEDEAKVYIDLLNLNDFEVYFDMEDMEGVQACCSADLPSMTACLTLSGSWDEKPTADTIKAAARHEVIELLLQPIWHAVHARSLNLDWANSQRHAVVRRLENLLVNLTNG